MFYTAVSVQNPLFCRQTSTKKRNQTSFELFQTRGRPKHLSNTETHTWNRKTKLKIAKPQTKHREITIIFEYYRSHTLYTGAGATQATLHFYNVLYKKQRTTANVRLRTVL